MPRLKPTWLLQKRNDYTKIVQHYRQFEPPEHINFVRMRRENSHIELI
jgi:hypothetical protein